MVEVGTAGLKEKEIKTDWPVTEGLTAGTQKQTGRQTNLTPQKGSTIREEFKKGL